MTARIPTVSLETVVDPTRPITYGIVLPGPDIPAGVPYVRVVDMQQGTVRLGQLRRTTTEIAHSYRRSALAVGDLLVSIRGHVGRTAFVPKGGDGANLTQDTARVAVLPSVDRRYIRWFIESPVARRWIAQHTKGVAVTGINLGDLRKLPVPLPSREEQRRIADILDKADAIRRKRKEAIALTEQLLRSAFLEMFGDPVTNPKGWEVKPLGELAENIDYGVTASADVQPVGPKFLRITDIQGNRVDWSSVPYCDCEASTAARARLDSGDIVFARTGATTGKSFRIRSCPDGAVFASYLIRVRPGSRVASGYLSEFFQSPGYWSQIRFMAEGAAQPGVNASKLAALRVPVPPIAQQLEMARFADGVLRLQANGESALRTADALFESLVQRAFSGEFAS